MRIGLVTDSLGDMPLDDMTTAAAELGIKTLEFCCGNWSSAPHINAAALVESEPPVARHARDCFASLAMTREASLTRNKVPPSP
ncbi:MAG TPA: hypothetical protein VGG99_03645 [Acetobacteraceae bacterium]|jgi:sugar phosphate isomerase/epimerase